jgi:MFS family permease
MTTGGLKLSEVQLAGPLSFSGACLILVSLLAFPAAQKAWGTLAVTRCGLVLAVLVAFAIPSTSFAAAAAAQTQAPAGSGADSGVPHSDLGWLAWGLLYLAMLLKSLAGCFAFTGTMIVVNTSVEPQQLGEVNGVGQSLASLARGVGPAVGGLLWGITVHLQGRVAGAQLLPFACVAATAVTALVIYAFVQPSDGVEVERTPGTTCCQE